jgi:hypothetical protein
MLSSADSSLGYRHTEAAKTKVGEALRKAWLAKDQAARDKALANLAKGPAACSKAVLATNIETGETVEYVSQVAAGHGLGVSAGQ